MNISLEVATLSTALAALITGVLGYVVGVRRIRAQIRSANRKEWMNRVVRNLTDLLVACGHSAGDAEGIARLVIELELLLNPADEVTKTPEALQARRELVSCLNEIDAKNASEDRTELPGFMRENLSRAQPTSRRDRIISHAKVILAKEWLLVMTLR